METRHRKARSDLLRGVREFFFKRGFVEVHTPSLAPEVIPELHIDPIPVIQPGGPQSPQDPLWLQASPELHMKRLLAEGATAIFQITRSFRANERGRLHHPEFTIVEWYRVGDDMHAGMCLLGELCQGLLDTPPAIQTSYAEVFQNYLGICPHTCATQELARLVTSGPANLQDTGEPQDRDTWLNLLLGQQVEPHLGQAKPEIVYDFPASQAALARIRQAPNEPPVAERFELYYHGIELANGYHELTDAVELRGRLEQVNAARLDDGRTALPMPKSLLAAMERGLPDCAGVALGFDRLVMLAVGAQSIQEVIESD